MKVLRAAWRALRALAHVLRGLWIIRTEFGRLTPDDCALLVREWSRGMLRIMGVALEVRGSAPTSGPMLLLSNHISWLDILVMNAACPVRFVSKADVKHWPVLGALITGAGTILIERESRRDAMRVVHQMAEHLQGRDLIAVFPEGRPGMGAASCPFMPTCCRPPFPPMLRCCRSHCVLSMAMAASAMRRCLSETPPCWRPSGPPCVPMASRRG